MDYKSYKTASERHLETCIKLKEIISSTYSGDSLTPQEEKQRDELLGNIYYLTGYIIECIVCYAILKYIDIDKIFLKWNFRNIKSLTSIHSKLGVSYSHEGLLARWYISNPRHEIGKNLRFFTDEARLTGLNIRGIDKNIDSDLKKMIDNWTAEYRYYFKDSTILRKHRIFSFLKLAEEIHNGLRTKITLD